MAFTEEQVKELIAGALERMMDAISVETLADKLDGVVMNAIRVSPSQPGYPSVAVMFVVSTKREPVDKIVGRFENWGG